VDFVHFNLCFILFLASRIRDHLHIWIFIIRKISGFHSLIDIFLLSGIENIPDGRALQLKINESLHPLKNTPNKQAIKKLTHIQIKYELGSR
jgi:hypothetical protein